MAGYRICGQMLSNVERCGNADNPEKLQWLSGHATKLTQYVETGQWPPLILIQCPL